MQTLNLGPFICNQVHSGDCLNLARQLPSNSVDVIVTSPPYWGQRSSNGVGIEEDPREYIRQQVARFVELKRALKPNGLLWINVGDSYNTPVNWKFDDHKYSSLGPGKNGLGAHNSAYTKPRHKRKAFIDPKTPWLRYGNLLALPYRLVIGLCDEGYYFRGEVIWQKVNPMPEGKCRRPHRGHEGIYLLAKTDQHDFQISPPVRSVWSFANEGTNGVKHFSRFPTELPRRCIQAYGKVGEDVVVLDPYSGSGTTGTAAISLGCTYVGFEIDESIAAGSNEQLRSVIKTGIPIRATRPRKSSMRARPTWPIARSGATFWRPYEVKDIIPLGNSGTLARFCPEHFQGNTRTGA